MVLKILLVLLLAVCVHFDTSQGQSCGTAGVCGTEYDTACPVDSSTSLGNCMQSQSSCNAPIQPPANASVQCYSTCIIGATIGGALTPVQCCADPLLVQPISQTVDPNYVIFRIYDPNSPGLDNYRHNTICNYNIQCPSNFNLHYALIRRNIEPSSSTGDCLDFLRYHFTATGQNVDTDVCGNNATDAIPPIAENGFHGSSLNFEFRSNRIGTASGFFLAITCINPARSRVTRQVEQGLQQRRDCVTSRLLSGYRVGKKKRSIQPFDIDKVFHIRNKRSFRVPTIRVTTGRVLKYEDNTLIVEERGKILYRFKNVQLLQVFNRIEGYLSFYSRSDPPGRTFPGYGKLHLGYGIAYFIQTIVDPRFLLSAEEDLIVSELIGELFRRQAFNNERFYFTPPTEFGDPAINCTVNFLAELNSRSCTAVVRAAADYFLRTDPFLKYCRRRHSG